MRELNIQTETGSRQRRCTQTVLRSIIEAAAIAIICFAGATLFNAMRPNGIAFIHRTPYEIMVPCPETLGDVDTLSPKEIAGADSRVLIIDARPKADFEKWHVPNSMHLAFDYLESVSPCQLQSVVSSGARQVIVYGDGDEPDTGEQLARELAGSGIRNVGFVKGGAGAIQKSNEGGQR